MYQISKHSMDCLRTSKSGLLYVSLLGRLLLLNRSDLKSLLS